MAGTLAIECSFLRKTTDLPSVFGFDVAVKGILDAILRYGTQDRILLFHPPARPIPEEIVSGMKTHAEVRPESLINLPRILRKGDITCWFQPDTQTEAVNYRSALSLFPFPFSTVIHIAWSPRLIRTQFLWLLLDAFAPCDSFICTSQSVRHAVRETLDYMIEELRRCNSAKLAYKGRLDVLPLGVDTDRFRPLCKPEVRRELMWPEDAFTILWLGRFSVVDKADLLPALRMFRRLVETNPNKRLRFVLAGTDRSDIPFYPSILEFAGALGVGENVIVLPHVAQDNRHKLFAAADVFTSPVDNLQETFGIAPVEAMAAGTPQVVSDWDGYKDTVEHGVTGYKIPTYWAGADTDEQTAYGIGGFGYQGFLFAQSVVVDLREYQAALQRLISDPGLHEAMSHASRARALRLFSWPTVVRSYEELWSELSAISRSLQKSDFPEAPFARAMVYRRFASFPTFALTGSEPICISDEGARLLSGAEPFPWHSPIEQCFISEEQMKFILDFIARLPGTFEGIVSRLVANGSGERGAIVRALMWGMKHGLLEKAHEGTH
jgi:D-inositol-3-phosphate glycosyltransferase